MNKATKIVVILMITTIVLYTVVGINRKNEIEQNNVESGDTLTSGENENELEIKYEVTSGDNEIILKGISEGSISTTSCVFENEKLSSIILKEEITSGDNELIEKIFNYMQNDTEISMVYSTLEMEGNTITAILKNEYVEAYGEATKEEVYQELLNTLK